VLNAQYIGKKCAHFSGTKNKYFHFFE